MSLTLDEITEDITLDNQQMYYKIRLAEHQKQSELNLVVKLLTSDEFSDPDMFISFTNEQPDSPGSSDIMCTSEGGDTCTISHERLN